MAVYKLKLISSYLFHSLSLRCSYSMKPDLFNLFQNEWINKKSYYDLFFQKNYLKCIWSYNLTNGKYKNLSKEKIRKFCR
jgi:hypothetical protein